MKKILKVFAFSIGAFVIGFSLNNFALSNVPAGYKVAVIDVPLVVENSLQIKNLKNDQQTKMDELVKFIEDARKDVAVVTDEKKKKSLEEKYQKKLISKKEKLDKDYIKQLAGIDQNIAKTVKTQAKAGNYDLVLTKGAVLSGGDDITQSIIKIVSSAE